MEQRRQQQLAQQAFTTYHNPLKVKLSQVLAVQLILAYIRVAYICDTRLGNLLSPLPSILD